MGFGPSKIDYKERDFTKEPLDDQEIDILLQALPEENVIDSIESEGREKILRAMSDQKVFNIRGDNIFDYYFTNNKEDIKGCMTNRIKQNDVSKFMATLEGSPTMELTVQDCREYANSINAPFNGDYNNTNNPKGCFSQVSNAGINKVYYNNTSNEDTDCGAYGKSYCIEKNPTPTPCSDEKFNKMIDTIPGIVNQPIQELLQNKSNEYNTEKSALQSQYDTLNTEKTNLQSQYDTLNTEKTNLQSQYDTLNTSKTDLQSQYDTLNTEKTNLQSQYDTLEQKRQQKLEVLALDGFLANPEMYNKMLKEKMSQKSLDIFTKDGDIKFDVEEVLNLIVFSHHGQVAYETGKSFIPDLIKELKKTSLSSLDQFKTKDTADELIGFGNLIIAYLLYSYLAMKIATQHNSTDKQIVPNSKIYEDYQEFFNELGIEEQQFEYVLKFIGFNTFKKVIDYESKNDVKGLDIVLKDSLKILEEFIGKEYVNSLSNFNFDVDNYKKSLNELVERTSGPPHKNISEKECYDWAEMKGLENRGDYENSKEIPGCFRYAPNNKVYYNKTGNKNRDCDGSFKCIQKENYKPLFKSFRKNVLEDVKEVTTGKPLGNLNKQECYQWAEMKGFENRGDYKNSKEIPGCFHYAPNNKVYYNETGDKNRDCDTRFKCIQKPKKYSKKELDVLESEIQKNLLSNVVRVTDGNNIKTVSEQQCKAYAKSLGTTMRKGNDTSGCYLAPSGVGTSGVYYNKKTGKGKCYYNSDSDYRVCIQNNLNRNNTYSKTQCRGSVGGEYDCRVDGTWDQITVKGWDRNKYGQKLDDAKHFCNTHKDCVAVASSNPNWNWPVHTTSKFKPCHNKIKVSSEGKPDMSVSKDECKEYNDKKGRSFKIVNESGNPKGCFIQDDKYTYYNVNTDSTSDCGNSYGSDCVQKTNYCDPKMNYHTKRECKKPIDGVWTKIIGGKSCEWECPGRSGIEKYTVPKFKTTANAYACSARDYTYDKNKKVHSGGNRKLVQGSKGHFSCRSQGGSVYGYKSYKHQDDAMTYKSSCSDWDNPAMFYKAVSTETVDINVGSSTGKTKVVDLPHKNMTVSNKPINKQNPNWPDTFEVAVSGTKLTVTRTDSDDAWGQKLVLRGTKENLPTVSEEECKAYADTHGYSYLVDNWDSKLKGCSIHTPTNRVFFNTHETGDGLNCGQGDQLCIQKQYYKVAGSGVCDKPEDIVPQNECKKAAKSLGFEYKSLGFGNKGEHAQSGCFMDGNILFHFDNKWKGDNYKKVGDYGGRTYLCKR